LRIPADEEPRKLTNVNLSRLVQRFDRVGRRDRDALRGKIESVWDELDHLYQVVAKANAANGKANAANAKANAANAEADAANSAV
jgi:hypothetical protein